MILSRLVMLNTINTRLNGQLLSILYKKYTSNGNICINLSVLTIHMFLKFKNIEAIKMPVIQYNTNFQV
jgi:hypothetical protein